MLSIVERKVETALVMTVIQTIDESVPWRICARRCHGRPMPFLKGSARNSSVCLDLILLRLFAIELFLVISRVH